jgi:hypothetical protein
LQLLSTLTSLDPTPRRLPSLEKYRRSLHILQLAYADLKECTAKRPASNEATQLVAADERALGIQTPTPIANELSEQLLGLAEKTWQARLEACGAGTSSPEEPLRLIMEKLAQ